MSEAKPAVCSFSFPEGEPNLGEGVSRAKHDARTKEFKVKVAFQGAKPLTLVLLAENGTKAKLYAKNRWPNCQSIELLK